MHRVQPESTGHRNPAGRFHRQVFPLLATIWILLLWSFARGQCEIATVYSEPEAEWWDMALYRTGGKLFVADRTAALIRVFDAATLAPLGEIPLAGHVTTPPQSLAVHEASGQLFAVADNGWATSVSQIVVIDADTLQVQKVLNGLGYSLIAVVDEARSRLYLFGGDNSLNDALTAIDVHTHAVVGSLAVRALVGSPHSGLDPTGGINPVTGELLLTNIHEHKFVLVDPATLAGTVVEADNSRGWTGIWNWAEHKVYITTVTWGGYFSYDRDTGTTGFAGCVNDGTYLYYNARTNRIYSDAEVDRNSVIIEGPTDACQELTVGGGLTSVNFFSTKHHVYFVGDYGFNVIDEDSLTSVAWFDIPGPEGGGVGGAQAIVDPGTDRVYIRSYRDMTSGEISCVMAVDDRAPLITRPPEDRTIRRGEHAFLDVGTTVVGSPHFQWYRGQRGDVSIPVGTDSPELVTPALWETESFWVQVSDDLGQGKSREAWVTIDPSPGNWVPQTSNTSRDLNTVFFLNGAAGWAAGVRGTILKTLDGGTTWQPQISNTSDDLYGIWFMDANHGWICGAWDTILHTTDGGAAWTAQLSPTTYKSLFDVTFLDANTGWIVGASGAVLKTTDSGANWQQAVSGVYDWFYTLSFADAATGWMAGYGGAVFGTTDGGDSWQPQSAATVDSLRDSHFAGLDTGWLVGDRGRIFHTGDGGATWLAQAEEQFSGAFKGVWFVDGQTGWAVGEGGQMAKTVDGGVHWFPVDSGTTRALQGICFRSPSLGWAVGAGGTILKYQPERDPADLNGDGTANAEDLVLLAAVLAENLPPPGDGAGDVDGNGALDIRDLMLFTLFLA